MKPLSDIEKIPLYDLSDVICTMFQSIIERKRKQPEASVEKALQMVIKLQNVSNYYYTIVADKLQADAMRALIEHELKIAIHCQSEQKKEIEKLTKVLKNDF